MKRILTSLLVACLALAPLAASAAEPNTPAKKPDTTQEHKADGQNSKAKATKKTRAKDHARTKASTNKSKAKAHANTQLGRDKNLH